MVGDPPGGPEVVERPSRRSGSGRETLPKVQNWSETHPEVRKWSGDPPSGPGLVGRSFHSSGSSRKAYLEVRKWSGDNPGGSELVGRPT